MSAHAYHPHCGCASCGNAEESAERDDGHLDGLVSDLRADDAKLREAEEWVAGSFDSDHYAEVTLALHALHRTEPADLMGSAVLANLYRLARVDHDAIEAELRRMAADRADSMHRRAA